MQAGSSSRKMFLQNPWKAALGLRLRFTYPSAKAPAEGNDAAQNISWCWLCGPITPDSLVHFQCYNRASRRSPLGGLSHFQDMGQELLLWSFYTCILVQVCSDCWTYVIRISLCSAPLKIQIPQCVCPFDTRHSFTDISGAISGTRHQSQNAFLQSSFLFQSICIIYRRLGNRLPGAPNIILMNVIINSKATAKTNSMHK